MKINWSSRLSGLDHKVTWWVAAVLFAGALAWYWDSTIPNQDSDPKKPESVEAADTFIPAGFVLVPIEVANYESLDSILGKFGVVDLYIPSPEPGGRPKKVASKIKILRAPLNPNHFAVLAREEESTRLVQQAGAFTVVVQNPKRSDGTGFVNGGSGANDDEPDTKTSAPKRPRSRISVEAMHAE